MGVHMKRPYFSVFDTCCGRPRFQMTVVLIEGKINTHITLILLENCSTVVVATSKGLPGRLARVYLLEVMTIRGQNRQQK